MKIATDALDSTQRSYLTGAINAAELKKQTDSTYKTHHTLTMGIGNARTKITEAIRDNMLQAAAFGHIGDEERLTQGTRLDGRNADARLGVEIPIELIVEHRLSTRLTFLHFPGLEHDRDTRRDDEGGYFSIAAPKNLHQTTTGPDGVHHSRLQLQNILIVGQIPGEPATEHPRNSHLNSKV